MILSLSLHCNINIINAFTRLTLVMWTKLEADIDCRYLVASPLASYSNLKFDIVSDVVEEVMKYIK